MKQLTDGTRTLPARRLTTTAGPRDVYGPLVLALRDAHPAVWWGEFPRGTRVTLEAVTAEEMQVELELLDAEGALLARAERTGRRLAVQLVVGRTGRLHLRATRRGTEEVLLAVRLVAHRTAPPDRRWHFAPTPAEALA